MAVLFNHQLLAKVRVELGLTQEDAARTVGVDVRTYRRYESGEVNEGGGFAVQRASRRQILERISRELGVDTSELLLEQTLPTPPQASLPRARHFVGRVQPISRLRAWLADTSSPSRVFAVVGIGGAGKTSLVEHVLSLGAANSTAQPFVHSFYDEPSVDVFLARAAQHLAQVGAEPVDNVLLGLRSRPASTLVLDGLELAQASGEGERSRGELEDRRLVRLFRAVAREKTLGRLLVTTRFPLVDLAAFDGGELESLALSPLDPSETGELLGLWGLRGSSARLSQLHAETGGHALSVAVLGSYAGELLQGDLEAASDLQLSDAARDQPLARKLQAILTKYANELLPLERELLGHICIFPRGIDEPGLLRLPRFQGALDFGVRAALSRLVQRGLAVTVGDRYSAHPFIREHWSRLASDATVVHEAERARLTKLLEGHPIQQPYSQGQLDLCEQLFEHTLRSGNAAEAYQLLARAMGGFANLGLRLGEFERGLRLTRALLPALPQLPNDVQWRVHYDRALYSAALGDLDTAVRAYQTLLGRDEADATVHRTLAYTLRLRGQLPEAQAHVTRSIELGRGAAARGTVARGLALRGAISTSAGELLEAGAAFDEARATGEIPVARWAIWEAEYLLAKGEIAHARRATQDNMQSCELRGWTGHVAHCYVILGRAAVAQGALADAEAALDSATDWCVRSRELELSLHARQLELALASAQGDSVRASQARAYLTEAALAGGFGAVLTALERA